VEEQLPTGTILIKEVESPSPGVGLYARVSSTDQKRDVEAQLGRLLVYAQSKRWTIVEAVSEVGSGLHGRRQRFPPRGGASATAASAVNSRKVNVSCRYNFTAVSVWLKYPIDTS
jgi:predicted site-specific integrase-resolvase